MFDEVLETHLLMFFDHFVDHISRNLYFYYWMEVVVLTRSILSLGKLDLANALQPASSLACTGLLQVLHNLLTNDHLLWVDSQNEPSIHQIPNNPIFVIKVDFVFFQHLPNLLTWCGFGALMKFKTHIMLQLWLLVDFPVVPATMWLCTYKNHIYIYTLVFSYIRRPLPERRAC